MLVSATGANLTTVLQMQDTEPEHYQVCLVAAHNTRSKALHVAAQHGVETWPGDFDDHCGLASQARTPEDKAAYRRRGRAWHDRLNERLSRWEAQNGELDLIVLAYHRWIEGDLLDRFSMRMINQHPGDLSVLDGHGRRVLIGNDPVRQAIELGHASTRTSCFLVDASHDGGAVLCQGPEVSTGGIPATTEAAWQHERKQKELSDRPCLRWSISAYRRGDLSVGGGTHADGSLRVWEQDHALPLGGKKLSHEYH